MWLTILIWEIVSFKNPWAITTDQNLDLTNKKLGFDQENSKVDQQNEQTSAVGTVTDFCNNISEVDKQTWVFTCFHHQKA